MTLLESVLGLSLAVFIVLTFIGFYFLNKYYKKSQTRQTLAYEMGGRQVKGDMYQLLGSFALLDDYEQVILLSTTSKQASLDLIGIKADTIDFLELKKKGARLQTSERKIKKLVDSKKVRYLIKDVELPEDFRMDDRPEGGRST